MKKQKTKINHEKKLDYYINLPWTYTIEKECFKGQSYFIIRVNELPGICTDAEDLNEGMEDIKDAIACAVEIYLENKEPVPEPINPEMFKGKILYRTDKERHYHLAKLATLMNKSISKTIDYLVDSSLESKNRNVGKNFF